MKIIKIETAKVNIPLVTPFKTALRTVDSVNDIVVRITTDDGQTGFGEAPPTAVITGDTHGSIRSAIEDFIAPAIIGMEIENLDGIMKKLHGCILKNSSAKAAVDMAVYDLFAKSCRKPLYKILGGGRKEIETDLTISVNGVEEMVADSLKAVSQGFRILKIKVGKESKMDVERIQAIRQAVGPDIRLRIDANQGWSAKEAVKIIRTLEDMGIVMDLVEQPVNAHDFEGMKFVTSQVYTPILADESVFSPEDAIRIIRERAADLINIKLMKTGGIHEALKICAIAESFGMECMIGCMLESKIAVSAAAHLAAGRGIITRADLDGPSLCREDPYIGGPVFDGPKIIMNEDSGMGISKVEAFCD
ncbi:dipeptide epimerase [Lacrimispora sphenoides]|uniref:Dipeptide epimerase n=1 Tax=Lacrimispora sphenoides JCM 1415 TaxID=1297793 RepID=A0ABY1CDD8_9FIRM|nr:dipeptide epimerase [Lacrimispora sphenoides]SET95199.1 o-succinylbenzoate synthase [[Clostridium] sphenoides JCM 1415]SUY52671.1 mandelate racemase/muconate lactonizing protein [Lacrimispora sphenoides]